MTVIYKRFYDIAYSIALSIIISLLSIGCFAYFAVFLLINPFHLPIDGIVCLGLAFFGLIIPSLLFLFFYYAFSYWAYDGVRLLEKHILTKTTLGIDEITMIKIECHFTPTLISFWQTEYIVFYKDKKHVKLQINHIDWSCIKQILAKFDLDVSDRAFEEYYNARDKIVWQRTKDD